MKSAPKTSAPEREQMPGVLRHLDDPWGITWRVTNLARRFSVRRSARFLYGYARPRSYERPVFVLSVPRSASTMVFHLLSESAELGSMMREGHDLWRTYHHPRYHGWRSDNVGSGAIGPGERRFVSAYLYSVLGRGRFVEKTPENSLRVPYILELFPDARFIVISRNPCDVVNSLINAWRHPAGRFRSYFVPEDLRIEGYPHRRRWCFALIEGWRDYRSATVPEIAFAQWAACTEALVEARDVVPPEQWYEHRFEDLVARPREGLAALCRHAEIAVDAALEAKLESLLVRPVNKLSEPRPEKWRAENFDEVRALLPRIAPLAHRIGYEIDEDTGAVPGLV